MNDPRGLAPTGWHIPSDAEWDTLSTHLGKNAGGKLKDTGTVEAGTGLWFYPNAAANNKTGFTAIPGSNRDNEGTFYPIGNGADFWSSTEFDATTSFYRNLYYARSDIRKSNRPKQGGLSVRCIKD